MLKRFDDNVMSANRDIIIFFTIYSQSAPIQKPDSGPMVYKTYIFINSNLTNLTNLIKSYKFYKSYKL